MWTCDCPGEIEMSGNEKGASETMKFLAAKETMWGSSMVYRYGIDQRN